MSYRHVRQPLSRTIHRDIVILEMVDSGVQPKNVPRLVPAVSVFVVYQAIERRKRFPKFYVKQTYEILRTPKLENG